MKNIVNYIDEYNTAYSEFKAVTEGKEYKDSVFESLSEKDFLDVFEDVIRSKKININESKPNIVDYINMNLNNVPIEEGALGAVLGGVLGLTVGPTIGKAICSALNIQKGALYDLLTSRLVTTAIATKLGLRA